MYGAANRLCMLLRECDMQGVFIQWQCGHPPMANCGSNLRSFGCTLAQTQPQRPVSPTATQQNKQTLKAMLVQRILPCTGWHAAHTSSRLPAALPLPTNASFLLDRLASNRHASTSTTPPKLPPGIKFRPRTTPLPVEATPTSSSASSRVERSTQQFFDDDDDWSNPVDVAAPTVDDDVDENWKPTATPTGAAAVKTKPMHVHVKTAEFIKSSRNRDQCPAPRLPEFAVIGRSNVGKSSLINMITGKKNLALVSKTPGTLVMLSKKK